MGQLQERYKNYREPQKYMAAGVYPYFREITSKQMTEVTDIDGHKILMFGSNAYQGLTNDQRVIDAAKAALDKYGSGCAGSRFLNGTLDLHVQLEKELILSVKRLAIILLFHLYRDVAHIRYPIGPSVHHHGRTVGGHDDLDIRIKLQYQTDELLLPFEMKADFRLIHKENV